MSENTRFFLAYSLVVAVFLALVAPRGQFSSRAGNQDLGEVPSCSGAAIQPVACLNRPSSYCTGT